MLVKIDQASASDRWDTALAEINAMSWGFLNKTPKEVENFLRSFSIRNFAFDEHSIGVQKTLCHIIDAFQFAADQRLVSLDPRK